MVQTRVVHQSLQREAIVTLVQFTDKGPISVWPGKVGNMPLQPVGGQKVLEVTQTLFVLVGGNDVITCFHTGNGGRFAYAVGSASDDNFFHERPC